MTRTTVHQQLHGYRKGHQLLSGSLDLDSRDQDAVDSLSDLTGRLRPGERFAPYLTAYPLPSHAYYVVAKTFQDLKAPRSGCVLTRSLFVPMDVWVELKSLESLLTMLVPVHEGEEALPSDKPTGEGIPPKKVSDGRVVELVHALFLEDGRPIVVFDAAESDLIATRLLVALWPSLRRDFSLCTLALGPRRLGDRDFDLLFAPLSVQSRFSRQGFCRIGVRGSLPRETVHRLAIPTAKRIFHSDEPSLAAPDVLDLLDKQERSDRDAVRMVLRWEELAARAETTPTAVLGMLDILNARGGPGSQGWGRILPMVSTALDLAAVRSSPRESWNFLVALTAKVEWNTAPAALVRELEEAIRALARAEPEEALAVMDSLTGDVHAPAAVLKGLGDGVAESPAFETLSECLTRLEPDRLLRLVNASDRLGEALATAMNAAANRWLNVLVHMLEGEDVDARHQVRRRLLSQVDGSVAAETIPSLLANSEGTELADLAVELAGRGKLRFQPFYTAFAQAARNSGSVDVVRDAVASQVRSADVDSFLLDIIEFTRSDVDWVLDLPDGGLAGRLLTTLVGDADPTDIQSLLSTGGRASRVVSTLHAALPTSASQIAGILTLDLMGDDAGLDVGFEVVSMLPAEGRQAPLERWLLRQVLCAAPLDDARLPRALADFSAQLTPDELVAAATASSIGPSRVSKNLGALNDAPQNIRDRVVGVVDVLSQRLVERRWEKLDEGAYRAWAAMLADSTATEPERRIEATSTVFDFAMRHRSHPVSSLVVASFPTVYRELPKLKKLGIGNDLSLFYPYYWLSKKKPKDARRELIDDLVDAFLRSSWPPADLIVAALKANRAKQVVKHVRKRFSGTRYLESVAKDAKRLDDELRHRVLACLPDTA